MPEAFDPYRKWLGIPPSEQPPHHYRLLAVGLFEDDPDVIESAADQRMAHLRTFQAGPHSALSQKLLNEVAAAKLCLLSADRKTEYDAQLRRQLARPAARLGEPLPIAEPAASIAAPVVRAMPVIDAAERRATSKVSKPGSAADSKRRSMAVWIAGIAGLCVCVVAAYAMIGSGSARRSAANKTPTDGPQATSARQDEKKPVAVAKAPNPLAEKPVVPESSNPREESAIAPSSTVRPSAADVARADMPERADQGDTAPPAAAGGTDGARSDKAAEAVGPPLASAPFDAKQARAHQEAWARHLNVPVEQQNALGMRLVLIPPGEFSMGSTPEQVDQAKKTAEPSAENNRDRWAIDRLRGEMPAHRVAISRPFLLGATEVTIGQYRRFVDATKYVTESERFGGGSSSSKEERNPQKKSLTWRGPGGADNDQLAVRQVTWADAAAFCNWLSEAERKTPCYRREENDEWSIAGDGNGYRLPTEAEWENACRAGTTTQYFFGDDPAGFSEYGWSIKSGPVPQVHPVAAKKPNPFGLFDMHGNMEEWCQDWLAEDYYPHSPARDPKGAESGTSRVMRSGSWQSPLLESRSAFRRAYPPFWRFEDVGFRVVCVSTDVAQASVPLADRGKAPSAQTDSEPMPGKSAAPGNLPTAAGKQSQVSANQIATFKKHTGAVTRVVFHPTLPLLASAGKDGRVLLWNLDKQTQRQFAKFTVEVWALKFSPGGELLAFGSRDWWKAQVSFHDLDSTREVKALGEFKFGGGAVASIAYSPDGLLFAAGQDDGTIRLWSATAFQELSPLSVGSNAQALAFGPVNINRKQRRTEYVLVAGCKDGSLKKLSITTTKTKDGVHGTFEPADTAFAQLGSVLAVRFTPDGKRVACTRSGGAICFYDPDDGKQLAQLLATGGEANWISFHPQLPWCVTAHNNDHLARVWDIDAGQTLCELKGHTGGVLCAEFSRDGQRVATASEDFSIKLWELPGEGVPEAPKRARKTKPAAPLVGD